MSRAHAWRLSVPVLALALSAGSCGDDAVEAPEEGLWLETVTWPTGPVLNPPGSGVVCGGG